MSATLTDAGGGALGGTAVVGRTIGFTIGTQSPSPSPTTNATGSASTSTMALTQAPNSYTVASTFAGDSDYLAASDSDPFTIRREDARETYTGALFAASNSATDGRAVVTLAATIQDITAAVGDPDFDPNAGDILKATIKFINRDSNTVIATVPIGLVTIGDNKTGVATYNWNVDVGTADSAQYTVGMRIEGYYTRDSSDESTVVTVSKPIDGSITGGGYVVLTTSAGLKAGDVNKKNNVGFNVRNQKSGPNPDISYSNWFLVLSCRDSLVKTCGPGLNGADRRETGCRKKSSARLCPMACTDGGNLPAHEVQFAALKQFPFDLLARPRPIAAASGSGK